MVATTPRSEHRLARFDRVERLVHWATATLLAASVTTAAVLYLPVLSTAVGRRVLVRDVHVVAGLALPLPFLAGLRGRRGAGLRRDVAELNRWPATDRIWFRSLGRRARGDIGKFNAGQKAFAALVAGAVPAMLLTGVVMRWFGPFPLSWRTGATFVHDWMALALGAAAVGHVVKALADRVALAGMLTGRVPVGWALRHHPRWDAVGPATPGSATVGDARGGETDERPAARRAQATAGAVAGVVAILAGGAVVAARPRLPSPGSVAVAYEEALDRGDAGRAWSLAAPELRGCDRRAFVERLSAELVASADLRGTVVRVEAGRVDVAAATAAVDLRVVYSDGLAVDRRVALRRLAPGWRVERYEVPGESVATTSSTIRADTMSTVRRPCTPT